MHCDWLLSMTFGPASGSWCQKSLHPHSQKLWGRKSYRIPSTSTSNPSFVLSSSYEVLSSSWTQGKCYYHQPSITDEEMESKVINPLKVMSLGSRGARIKPKQANPMTLTTLWTFPPTRCSYSHSVWLVYQSCGNESTYHLTCKTVLLDIPCMSNTVRSSVNKTIIYDLYITHMA